jgi:hypothetical protein
MKEALSSSETPVLTRATRRNIPEDTILHSHRRENPKSYIPKFCCPGTSVLFVTYFDCKLTPVFFLFNFLSQHSSDVPELLIIIQELKVDISKAESAQSIISKHKSNENNSKFPRISTSPYIDRCTSLESKQNILEMYSLIGE